jgi:hypothetical protein
MKRFLVKTVLVFVALFTLMWCLDLLITHRLHHSKATAFVGMNDVFFDSTHYDVVVMGSSRGLVQYDTRILDTVLNINCYNLSVNGRGVISQVIKYRLYEKRHGRPKLIIQNIDCFLLEEDNGFEREQYLPYLFDDDLFEMIKNREGFNALDRKVPLIRYSGYEQVIKEGLGFPNKMDKKEMYKGYRPDSSGWDGHKLATIEEIGFGYNPTAVSTFRSFLNECSDKGIKVLFVYAPFFSGARRKMSDENKKTMFDSFDSLAKDYQIPILSWWDSPISEDTAFFYNATHLNAEGAKMFTHELATILKSSNLFYSEKVE